MEFFVKRIILGFVLSMLCSISYAQVYQYGNFKVQSLRVADGNTYVRFSPELDACEGGTHYRMHAVVSNENSVLISSLLTAYTAQQTIQYIFVSREGTKCSGSHVLKLDMIEFAHQ